MFSRAIARFYGRNQSGCKVSPDLVRELADPDWLLEVAVETVGEKPLAVALHRRGSERDHGDRGRALVLPQLPHRLRPGHVGHANVHQDEIGAVFESERETLDAARAFECSEPCELEDVARELPVLLVVVDDEDQLVGHWRCLLLDGDATPFDLAEPACPPSTAIVLASPVAAAYPLDVFSDFDRERRRIEAALHDGVQQDLAATVVALELARELLDSDPAAARDALEELATQVEGALERVRELAGTVYPSILPARGLTDALRSLDVETVNLERYPLEVEEAVYFSCSALRSRAGRARVWGDGAALRLELLNVSAVEGDELSHARERIAAVGGQLDLSAGRVSAAVPLK